MNKSNLLIALATRSRGYMNKIHLRGLKTSFCISPPSWNKLCAVANYIRPKLAHSSFKKEIKVGKTLELRRQKKSYLSNYKST